MVDPPSYCATRSQNLAFDILKDHPHLLRAVINVMRPDGVIVFSTNHQAFAPRFENLPLTRLQEITAAATIL